jgi:hypothetical protein
LVEDNDADKAAGQQKKNPPVWPGRGAPRLASPCSPSPNPPQLLTIPRTNRGQRKMGDRLTQLQDAVDQVSASPFLPALSQLAGHGCTNLGLSNHSWRNNSSHASSTSKGTTISRPWGRKTKLEISNNPSTKVRTTCQFPARPGLSEAAADPFSSRDTPRGCLPSRTARARARSHYQGAADRIPYIEPPGPR